MEPLHASRFAPVDQPLVERWAKFPKGWDRPYFPTVVGLVLEEVRTDYARMRLPYRPELEQPAGAVHGGAIATLIDTVVVPAVGQAYDPTWAYFTIGMNIRYIGAVVQQDAIAEGWIEQRGRTLVFCRAEVRTEDGKLAADGTLTYTVRPPRAEGLRATGPAAWGGQGASTLVRMRRRLLTLLVVSALLAACMQEADDPLEAGTTTTEDDGTTATTAGDGELAPDPIEWDECGGVECATLDVPLDYDDPTGETIELYVVRTPASGKRIGALFVNPGGPGASAAEFAEYLAYVLPEDITEHFDIVGVDPRGVGGSTPIACGLPPELDGVDASFEDAEDEAAYLAVSEEYVEDCDARYGDVLPYVGTPEVARDMDVVRAAMGDEQLSYLGYSYGTVIGQVYADQFPDRVLPMALDGAVELGPTGLETADEQAAGFETALARFAQYCDAAEGCGTAGHTLDTVEEVLQLAQEPGGIPVDDDERSVGPGEANLGISYALYSQSLWQTLGDALADAVDGDGGGILQLAEGYHDIGAFEIYFGVMCLDFAWPVGDPDAFFAQGKATAEDSPHFGEALVNDYVRCAMWPTPPVPLERVTAPGVPPILVVSTTGDPATPYEGGVAVADTLESGVLVTNEGEGHGVVGYGKPCIDDLVAAYLVDGDVPEDGYTCE